MSSALRLKAGSAAQNDAYTGLEAEITADLTYNVIRLHNGSDAGGIVVGEPGAGDGIATEGGSFEDGARLKLLSGTQEANEAYIGALAELTADTTLWVLRLHDGGTPGGFIVGEIERPAHSVVNYTPVFQQPEMDGAELETDASLIMEDYNPAEGNFFETQWTIAVDQTFEGDSVVYDELLRDGKRMALSLQNTMSLSLVAEIDHYVRVIYKARNGAGVVFESQPAIRQFKIRAEDVISDGFVPSFVLPSYENERISSRDTMELNQYDGEQGTHYLTKWTFATDDQFSEDSTLRTYTKIAPNLYTFDIKNEPGVSFEDDTEYWVQVAFNLTNEDGSTLSTTAPATRQFRVDVRHIDHDIQEFTPIFIRPEGNGERLQLDQSIRLAPYVPEVGEHYTTKWEISTDEAFSEDALLVNRHSSGETLNEVALNNGWALYQAGQRYWVRVTYRATSANGSSSYSSLPALRYFFAEEASIESNPIVQYTPEFDNPHTSGQTLSLEEKIKVVPYTLDIGDHYITHWEVASDADFTEVLFSEFGSDRRLTEFRLNNGWGDFTPNSEYYVRVSFKVLTEDGLVTYTTTSAQTRFTIEQIVDQTIRYTPTIVQPAYVNQPFMMGDTVEVEPYNYAEGTHVATRWEVFSKVNNVGAEIPLFNRVDESDHLTSFPLNNGWGDYALDTRYWVRVTFYALSDSGTVRYVSNPAMRAFVRTNNINPIIAYTPVFIRPSEPGEALLEDTVLRVEEYPHLQEGEYLTTAWMLSDNERFGDDEQTDVGGSNDNVYSALEAAMAMMLNNGSAGGGGGTDESENTGTGGAALYTMSGDWDKFKQNALNWVRVIFKMTSPDDLVAYQSQPAITSFVVGEEEETHGIMEHTPEWVIPRQDRESLLTSNQMVVKPYRFDDMFGPGLPFDTIRLDEIDYREFDQWRADNYAATSGVFKTIWEICPGTSFDQNSVIFEKHYNVKEDSPKFFMLNKWIVGEFETFQEGLYTARVTFVARNSSDPQGAVFSSRPSTKTFRIGRLEPLTHEIEQYRPVWTQPSLGVDYIRATNRALAVEYYKKNEVVDILDSSTGDPFIQYKNFTGHTKTIWEICLGGGFRDSNLVIDKEFSVGEDGSRFFTIGTGIGDTYEVPELNELNDGSVYTARVTFVVEDRDGNVFKSLPSIKTFRVGEEEKEVSLNDYIPEILVPSTSQRTLDLEDRFEITYYKPENATLKKVKFSTREHGSSSSWTEWTSLIAHTNNTVRLSVDRLKDAGFTNGKRYVLKVGMTYETDAGETVETKENTEVYDFQETSTGGSDIETLVSVNEFKNHYPDIVIPFDAATEVGQASFQIRYLAEGEINPIISEYSNPSERYGVYKAYTRHTKTVWQISTGSSFNAANLVFDETYDVDGGDGARFFEITGENASKTDNYVPGLSNLLNNGQSYTLKVTLLGFNDEGGTISSKNTFKSFSFTGGSSGEKLMTVSEFKNHTPRLLRPSEDHTVLTQRTLNVEYLLPEEIDPILQALDTAQQRYFRYAYLTRHRKTTWEISPGTTFNASTIVFNKEYNVGHSEARYYEISDDPQHSEHYVSELSNVLKSGEWYTVRVRFIGVNDSGSNIYSKYATQSFRFTGGSSGELSTYVPVILTPNPTGYQELSFDDAIVVESPFEGTVGTVMVTWKVRKKYETEWQTYHELTDTSTATIDGSLAALAIQDWRYYWPNSEYDVAVSFRFSAAGGTVDSEEATAKFKYVPSNDSAIQAFRPWITNPASDNVVVEPGFSISGVWPQNIPGYEYRGREFRVVKNGVEQIAIQGGSGKYNDERVWRPRDNQTADFSAGTYWIYARVKYINTTTGLYVWSQNSSRKVIIE